MDVHSSLSSSYYNLRLVSDKKETGWYIVENHIPTCFFKT